MSTSGVGTDSEWAWLLELELEGLQKCENQPFAPSLASGKGRHWSPFATGQNKDDPMDGEFN